MIIPTLNEAANLAGVLGALDVTLSGPHEVVVVDGGSKDETGVIAKEGGARLITCSPAGRARQLNRGVAETGGELLFFLHGDTLVPTGALDLIAEAFEDNEVVGGGFLREFDSDSRWLELTCRIADWRGEQRGVFLGDQGIFVKREVFEKMGGFDESLVRCEDLSFSMKLRDYGKIVALHPAVVSSARRFEELGPFRTTLRDWWWTLKHLYSA